MREQVLVPPIVVSFRRSLPQRAPFSFARRYLSSFRPRLSSRLSFRFPFRRRPALRLVVVLSRFPSRLSSERSVRRCPRFPSYPPPSLRRRFIRRPLPPRAPFCSARRLSSHSSFRRRPVPRLVVRSAHHSSARPPSPFPRQERRGVFLFDGGRVSEQMAGRRAGGRWNGQAGDAGVVAEP